MRFQAALACLVTVACDGGGGTEPIPTRGGEFFVRYVSLGGSLAAGFQSAGLTTSSQQQAYPVLLAQRADASFLIPNIPGAGCPVPMRGPLQLSTAAATCPNVTAVSGRRGMNVAVPGARSDKLTTTPALPTPSLQSALIGSRSQFDVARTAQPTFVTIEAGDQDVLRAALLGELGLVTSASDSALTTIGAFQSNMIDVFARLADLASLRGAAVIGVVDPIPLTPALSPGAFFFSARDASDRYRGKPVSTNCSPVTALGQPNPLATNLISVSVVFDALVAEINCDPAEQSGLYVLTADEQAAIRARVVQFNTILSDAANTRGWLYFDPNPVLASFLTATDAQGRFQHIRRCQTLTLGLSAAQMQAAVLSSCPVSGATAAPNMFGSLFTFDANTLSGEANVLLVNALAAAINTRYGTTLGVTP